jgi:hypothetical protein
LLFSAASIRTTKVSSAVINISMKRPWATLVPGETDVLTWPMSPGNIASTTPPAHMQARSCAGKRKRERMAAS